MPLSETYCLRVVEGEPPNGVPDVRSHEATRDLSATRETGIGS
jgi:hypothetical protein